MRRRKCWRLYRVWLGKLDRVQRAIEYLTMPGDPSLYPDQEAMREALRVLKEEK